MRNAKYSGRVRGMGLGPLLVRPTSRSSASSASRSSQKAEFNTRMNEMMAKWEEDKRRMDEQLEEERRRTNERIAAQSQMIEIM